MDYYSGGDVGTGWNPGQSVAGWGSGETQNSSVQQAQAATQMFRQMFQNATGRAPTAEELGAFQQQSLTGAINAPGDLGYSDSSSLANNFIQNQYSPLIAQHGQDVAAGQLDKSQQMIQDLVKKQTAATTADLTNQSGDTYRQFSGLMNNMGITPSSGAFQSGLGNVIGQSASNALNSALGGVSLPAISQIQGLSGLPQQTATGNMNLSHLNSLQDFGLQESLAKMFSGGASGAQNMLGMASSSAQGAGGLAQGYGALGHPGTSSYVCREMQKRGLLSATDLEDFYLHMFNAVWFKARAFWHYKVNGQKLVDAVNAAGLDWATIKPILFDRPMAESDPCKANDLFAWGCKELCETVAPELWDNRVMRTSFWDSIKFIPKLFLDKTFGKNFWRILRIKMLWIIDRPCLEAHP